jgi:hypothetical protein
MIEEQADKSQSVTLAWMDLQTRSLRVPSCPLSLDRAISDQCGCVIGFGILAPHFVDHQAAGTLAFSCSRSLSRCQYEQRGLEIKGDRNPSPSNKCVMLDTIILRPRLLSPCHLPPFAALIPILWSPYSWGRRQKRFVGRSHAISPVMKSFPLALV